MNQTSAINGAAPGNWLGSRLEFGPQFGVLFVSVLAAAGIPLILSLYWIAFPLAPESLGTPLRVSAFGCSLLLAFVWYRTPLSYAESNLLKVFGMAAVIWLIPTFMATDRLHALAGWIKMMVLFAICGFVARGLRHRATAHVFGLALLTSSLILVGFILYSYVSSQGFTWPTFAEARAFKGIADAGGGSLNGIAFVAVFSYLAGLCLVRSSRYLIGQGIVVVLLSTLFTGSRAPLVIIAASIFAVLSLNCLRSKITWLKVISALLLAGIVFGAIGILIFGSDQDVNKATEGRLHLWSVGLDKFLERPLFGYGYESWRDDLVSRLPGEEALTLELAKSMGGGYHNQYISVLAEEGLIGAFAASLVVWLLIRSSWLLAFCRWGFVEPGPWALLATIFLLLRALFEVPGLFGYGQDPADYLAYLLVAIVLSRFSTEQDCARLSAMNERAA